MGRSLEKAAGQVVQIVNSQREHIPPITTAESNPFPYDLKIKMGSVAGGGTGAGEQDGWGGKMGIF